MNKALKSIYILGIESSCDDTSIAVSCNTQLLSNLTANQDVHKRYGGVVPELASRAHQENIVPVYLEALKQADVALNDISAIAYTHGPGLLGSLLVGCSFAKSLALATNKPLLAVNHMEAHILAHMADGNPDGAPIFPFLNLTVSGGHTQLIQVQSANDFTILGESIDDAAGEAFDKAAKTLGLGYPGGPKIDQMAKNGKVDAFTFPRPKVGALDFSFSGLKTSLLYFLEKESKRDESFISSRIADICASYQHAIVSYLLDKIKMAVNQTGIQTVCVSGGVSANSYLNGELRKLGKSLGWKVHIPPLSLCTDNGGMIALAGYYKYQNQDFSDLYASPKSRWKPGERLA